MIRGLAMVHGCNLSSRPYGKMALLAEGDKVFTDRLELLDGTTQFQKIENDKSDIVPD